MEQTTTQLTGIEKMEKDVVVGMIATYGATKVLGDEDFAEMLKEDAELAKLVATVPLNALMVAMSDGPHGNDDRVKELVPAVLKELLA